MKEEMEYDTTKSQETLLMPTGKNNFIFCIFYF